MSPEKQKPVKDLAYYEALAHQLLEEWVRQRFSRGAGISQYGSANVFQGRLALSKHKGQEPRRRTRRDPKSGELHTLPFYPAQGTETPGSGPDATPHWLIERLNRIDRLMGLIRNGSKRGHRYYRVLEYVHRFKSMEIVAQQMDCSQAKAFELKAAAMDQLVLLLKIKA